MAYTSGMGGAVKPLLLLLTALAGLVSGAGVRARGFVFNGVSNRFLTPNGDGRNDNVLFRFSNPRDSAGTVKIYDLRGHSLTTIPVNPGDTSESWDGRVDGRTVDSGVYVYVVQVEGVSVAGTVVVIR
jgi:gliding motility-associated-like protein